MKLGEGGEAFFVFETSEEIPESLQTSPVISPASSPQRLAVQQNATVSIFQEPEFLDLNLDGSSSESPKKAASALAPRPTISDSARTKSDFGEYELLPPK